jgi:Gpi18-like mannosyltransferase
MTSSILNRQFYVRWFERLETSFAGNLRYLVLAFLLWRVMLYLGAYVGSTLAANNPSFAFAQPLSSWREFFFGAWVHWDAAWYMKIIQNGYSYEGPGVQANVAFFPLYPLLVILLVRGLGFDVSNYHAVAAAGIFVSNLSALLAMLVLYLLAKFEFEQKSLEQAQQLAFKTSLLFLFFPTSLFFASLYTEGLFLFLTVTSFYFIRRRRFLWAGIFGAAASMCRVNGVLLLLPFAIEYFRHWQIRPRKEALSFLLVPLGIVFYSGFLFFTFEEPFAFAQVQSAEGWAGASAEGPFIRVIKNIGAFVLNPENVYLSLEVFYAVGALILILFAFRYLPLSHGAYALAVYLLPTSLTTVSIQRYILAAFPLFLTLALFSRSDKTFYAGLSLSAFMLAVTTLMWINGLWVG